MVDVTFPFMVLFGGGLLGWITARVFRHERGRAIADVVVAIAAGVLAAYLVIQKGLLSRLMETMGVASNPQFARFAADLVFFSPVIGAAVGLAVLAAVIRLSRPPITRLGFIDTSGRLLRVAGYLLLAVSICLIVGVVALTIAFRADKPPPIPWLLMLSDLILPALLLAAGFGLSWLGRHVPPPQAPPPSPTG